MYAKLTTKQYVFQYITPVLLWMGLIFWFSHQPATDSSVLSGGITNMVFDVMKKLGMVDHISVDVLHHIIRKCAHFTIYFILGVLVDRAVSMKVYTPKNPKRLIIAIAICILYASSDELHQLFIAGRGSQIKDVILDSLGAGVGVMLHLKRTMIT